MRRFVISQHIQGPDSHWDFMLEDNGVLATWRVPIGPDNWAHRPVECRRIAEHRLEYLTYQGPISQDRGQLLITARGHYHALQITDDHWRIKLCGDGPNGSCKLVHIQQDRWQLTFQPT